MKHSGFRLALAALIMTGCASTHVSDAVDIWSLPESQQAALYLENGQYEEAIDAYRQLVAANPKHFKSVLYQRKVMEITESTSDPWRLIDEMKHTLDLFDTACAEQFEGATPEAVQQERNALEKYVYNKGAVFHSVYQKTRNTLYALFAMEFYELYTSHFPNGDMTCDVIYYLGDVEFFSGNYETSARNFERVLNECDNATLSNYPESYVDAALGYMLACDRWMRSDACPESPRYSGTEDPEQQELTEYPIAECRLRFIEAAKRYLEVLQKYQDEKLGDYSINAFYTIGLIYFDHNHFDKANQLFQKVIDMAPKSEPAVYACDYILESYGVTKKYKEILKYVREIKMNQEFMSNPSPLMPDLLEFMDKFEKQAMEKLGMAGADEQ